MTIQANQGFGVSVFGAVSGGGGGSTSPGGSSGQVQYNNGGAFGGMSGTTWSDANQSLAIASTGTGTGVTTSQPVLNLTQTWNAAGVTFTGLKFNATDTASASGSLLLDIGTGGGSYTSQLKVTKAGKVLTRANYDASNANYSFDGDAGTGLAWRASSQLSLLCNTTEVARINTTNGVDGLSTGVSASNGGRFALGSGGTNDTFLTRAAAATLQLGAADAAAPVAQTFKVQGVVAGTSNTAGTNFTIQGSQGTGTGAGGSIIFQVAPAGSSGTAQNAYSTALTIASDKSITMTGTSFSTSGAGINFVGGYFTFSNQIYARGTPSISLGASDDVLLYRDAANTLALRNGTNAQTFNVYNTFTSFGSGTEIWERASFQWTSNVFRISTSAGANGGTNRNIQLQSGGGAVDVVDGSGNSQINFATTTSTGLRVSSDRPIGFTSGIANGSNPDTTLRRVAAGILGVRGGAITDAGALSFIEQTAPAAPAANGVYIYAEDNGSGKTRLMALFNTGAAQQIAIEP